MGKPMKIRARLEGDVVAVKVLMAHVMETGRRKDQAGELVPAHFIQTVEATCRDRVVLSAQWGTAISANPFFVFRFKGGEVGDKVRITWVDSEGDSRTDETTVT